MANAEQMAPPTRFAHAVRSALVRLYDLSYLETCPLADWMLPSDSRRTVARGQAVRNTLLDAIESLHPGPAAQARGRAWRSYLVLRHKYVDGMSQEEIEEELALSARQVQREQQQALEALSRLLWDRRPADAPEPGPIVQGTAGTYTSTADMTELKPGGIDDPVPGGDRRLQAICWRKNWSG